MHGSTDVSFRRDASAVRVVSHGEPSRFRRWGAKTGRFTLHVSGVRGDADVHERRDERELRGVSRGDEYGGDSRGERGE